jgi:hypothetical protein
MTKRAKRTAHENNWNTGCVDCFWRAVRSYELGSDKAAKEILARYPRVHGIKPKLKRETVLYRGDEPNMKPTGISWTANLGIAAAFAGGGEVYRLRNPVVICRTLSPQFPAEEEYLVDLKAQKHAPETMNLSSVEIETLKVETMSTLNPENTFVDVTIGSENAHERADSVEDDLDAIRLASNQIVKEAFDITTEQDVALRESCERFQFTLDAWLGKFSSVPVIQQDCLLEGLRPADKRAIFLVIRYALRKIAEEIAEPQDRFCVPALPAGTETDTETPEDKLEDKSA